MGIIDESIISDFKMVSQGLNFDIEALDKREQRVKTSMSLKRKKQYEHLKNKIRVQSRAKTSKVIKRPKYGKNIPLITKLNLNMSLKEKENV